jgi:hypothetical protein
MASNLVELIDLLVELRDVEPDPNLEEGEIYASDGSIVTL